MNEDRRAAPLVIMTKKAGLIKGGCPVSRGQFEDWSRRRAVGLGAAAPQLRTVESKEWRQEDTGRRYPQGLEGAKVVGV